MAFCEVCGEKISKNAKRCIHCGSYQVLKNKDSVNLENKTNEKIEINKNYITYPFIFIILPIIVGLIANWLYSKYFTNIDNKQNTNKEKNIKMTPLPSITKQATIINEAIVNDNSTQVVNGNNNIIDNSKEIKSDIKDNTSGIKIEGNNNIITIINSTPEQIRKNINTKGYYPTQKEVKDTINYINNLNKEDISKDLKTAISEFENGRIDIVLYILSENNLEQKQDKIDKKEIELKNLKQEINVIGKILITKLVEKEKLEKQLLQERKVRKHILKIERDDDLLGKSKINNENIKILEKKLIEDFKNMFNIYYKNGDYEEISKLMDKVNEFNFKKEEIESYFMYILKVLKNNNIKTIEFYRNIFNVIKHYLFKINNEKLLYKYNKFLLSFDIDVLKDQLIEFEEIKYIPGNIYQRYMIDTRFKLYQEIKSFEMKDYNETNQTNLMNKIMFIYRF